MANVKSWVCLEYASTSQVQDPGAHGRMDRDVRIQPGFWHHGTGIHEIKIHK